MAKTYRVDEEKVRRLWFRNQGLHRPRGARLTRKSLVDHLERTGGLQLDSVNVVDRAHHLTLWSRFGAFDRDKLRRWIYEEKLAYEFWGHEACVLPARHLPLSRRSFRSFQLHSSWWKEHRPPAGVMREVRGRIREEGPMESAQFKSARGRPGPWWGWKQEKMALEILWRKGELAIADRRHFRRIYDLAEHVYPEGPAATRHEFEDGWLFTGLSGNGIASEKHLSFYFTSPRLKAPERRAVLARNLRKKRIVEVEVPGHADAYYALPETLENLGRLPEARGTTLVCPFDSFLWQRERAEELLDFRYRIEIYVPAPKREFGYYVLPILHEGRLVGRLDPKFHRDRGELEIKAIHLEKGFRADAPFKSALGDSLRDLAVFLGARELSLPKGWRRL